MKALFVLLAVSVSASAVADDSALLRCRAIADVAGRVACYDAIPVGAAPARPVALAVPTVAAAVPASTAAAPAAISAAEEAERNFGLTATQMRKPDSPTFIQSTLIGRIDGWGPNTTFRLANGQSWRVNDDSSGNVNEIDNPKIKITRNLLGTIFLEIEGSNQAPRVRRVQ
ncbi:hypothetical protein [Duganella sp. Dugasp56]|uniref:hypothetical protein n=1 Tax=Duganella sp. Dugasp56 TaxID=3243046 RepID=UPI0039AF2A63